MQSYIDSKNGLIEKKKKSRANILTVPTYLYMMIFKNNLIVP